MDEGKHCTNASYAHVCVAGGEIAEDYVRDNLYVSGKSQFWHGRDGGAGEQGWADLELHPSFTAAAQ